MQVYLVGEPVPQAVNDQWASRTTGVLYNMYGPTEATCGATIKLLIPHRKVTVGRPNPSTRVYILDRHQRLASPRVIGQIYLAGVQVSNGYLHQPQLTAERFVMDSVRPQLGEQMYATGDFGYWTQDGELICLGRNDRQIKLRGYRLDLDDLEARIATLIPDITGVAVTRCEDDLIAMIQPRSISPSHGRQCMREILPPHAVPRYVVAVDRFPMTGAGKLDYRAIVHGVQHGYPAEVVPNMSTTERQVAGIWSDILGIEPTEIQADSDFISIGGNSLLQLKLASRLSRAFTCSVSPAAVIGSHTLGDLCAKLNKLRACQRQQEEESLRAIQADSLSRIEA